MRPRTARWIGPFQPGRSALDGLEASVGSQTPASTRVRNFPAGSGEIW
jgi:hypothetical protein